ncbi:hypothetical protein CERSUDRAFT_113192 [Gelatoporia subvermispora B]|uniref:Uncharacterized protein n=1 Tax=Ceriporiopsis subvermispora (strain B) TaxID=914234 RepID=M2RGW7_CERS8|nr:hypothetical protein CERSUDRAFT_113192 [Gelatoporia subvermispora B]
MSHLIPPQEEKKTTGTSFGKLPVDHEYPPQQNAFQRGSEHATAAVGDAAEDARYLVPPQEEKVDTSSPAKSNIDKVVDRLEQHINEHSIRTDPELDTRDERLRSKLTADTIRAGAAGVTGEDLALGEDRKIV